MSEPIKECPFCGTESDCLDFLNTDTSSTIICNECEAEGPCVVNKELALTVWNRRPVEDALRRQISDLESLLEHIVHAWDCQCQECKSKS
jgi:Lar family restriction alleviation protein